MKRLFLALSVAVTLALFGATASASAATTPPPTTQHHHRVICACPMLTGNQKCRCPEHNLRKSLVNAAGPYYMYETYGSYAVGFAVDEDGEQVTESTGNGRYLYWTPLGTYQGFTDGTWQTQDGWYMAATEDCTGVVLKTSSSADGTIWASDVTGTHAKFINRYCDQAAGSQNIVGLAGIESAGSQYTTCGFGCGGYYEAFSLENA